MKATVVKIDMNATMNGKAYVEFVTQGQPYQGQEKPPRTHKLFKPYAEALIAIVATLEVGDQVEYKCDNTQYKNMNQLEKVGDGTGVPQNQTPPAKGGNTNMDKKIARAVAVKEATQIVLFGAKKTDEPTDLVGTIKDIARELEPFLLFDDQANEPVAGFNPDDEIPF